MSEYDVSEMEVEEQSEDGELTKSPHKHSPIQLSKDDNAFSMSEEEEDADDTADSLDIKPPQASVIHHHKTSSSRSNTNKRDKHTERDSGRREHVHGKPETSSHRKGHHRGREHREHREERLREKRHHREHREAAAAARESKRERERERERERDRERDAISSSGSGRERDSRGISDAGGGSRNKDKMSNDRGERVLEDLRERLLDKRRNEGRGGGGDTERGNSGSAGTGGGADRRVKQERRERDRERDRERRVVEEDIITVPPPRESSREKAERLEKEMRMERLLEAEPNHLDDSDDEWKYEYGNHCVRDATNSDISTSSLQSDHQNVQKEGETTSIQKKKSAFTHREMVRQKKVYRRELEARRERRHLEKEKERTLREIAKKRERSRSRERKKRRSEEQEDDKTKSSVERSEGEEKVAANNVVTVSDDSEEESLNPEEDSKQQSGGSDGGGEPGNRNDHSPEDEEGSTEAEEEEEEDSDSSTESEEDDDADTDSGGHHTDDETGYNSRAHSPTTGKTRTGTTGSGEDNDKSGTATKPVDKHSDDEEEEGNAIPFITDESTKSEVVLKEELPPYLPAIQGCRSVEEFQCLNRIEEGTYGVVYRARDKRTEEVVALKRLKMEKEKEGFPITSLREINTLLKAQHPNIVTVREIVVGSNMDKIFIVMDYVEHDLKSLMETMKQKKQVFIPGEVKCLMQQLLRAVAHLHDNWILHRDLKTSNLLLSHKGILKVGDFGLAREYGSPLKAYTPIVVTLWYRAPELLLCTKEYSTPVDMWSVGCIFGEFLSMEALFPGKSEVDQLNRVFKDLGTPNEKIWPGYSKLPAVQKMTFTEYPVSQLRTRFGTMITDVGMDLMNRFLTYDPVQRVTAEDALHHDYFKEAPLPIDPAMFPTWPAKSELGHRKAAAASPKPPPGGHEYKQLGDTDEDVPAGGFHMGLVEKGRITSGPGFSLKF